MKSSFSDRFSALTDMRARAVAIRLDISSSFPLRHTIGLPALLNTRNCLLYSSSAFMISQFPMAGNTAGVRLIGAKIFTTLFWKPPRSGP